MRKAAVNTFTDGLMMDANPLITAQSCLTDCLNGTLITYNGNEFTLQNDMGNVKLEKAKLPDGFVPIGMKEYGGIIYMALLNPVTNECEIGSMPSPSYEIEPTKRDNDNDSVNLVSSKMIDKETGIFNDYFVKLFEFEQLTLNPGDMYGIAYKVKSGKDPILNKNVYNVELYAVDKDNKQHLINDPQFLDKTNKGFAVGNEEFVYMDKAVSAVLGLKVSIQEINWFESVIYEKDKDLILKLYWANKLQDESTNEDDIFVSGIRLKADNDTTFYLNTNDHESEKVKETLVISQQDFPEVYEKLYKEGETLELELTPYDQFHFIDSLTRKLTITIGKDYVYDSSNSTYKFKYSKLNKSLRLDFTMDTINMVDPYLYVEFYDVWSDYSVIIPVEDINPAGLNTLFVDTINEPVEDEWINTQGGVDRDLLAEFSINKEELTTTNIYQPILSSTVRIKQILRENNLYLVRMAAIDKNRDDLGVCPEAKQYTSDYKLLIINENYNSWYDKLIDTGKTTGVDFNSKNLNSDYDFNFEVSLVGSNENTTKTVDDKLTCKTIKNDITYYYDYNLEKKNFNDQSYTEKFNRKGRYLLDTELKNATVPFGLATEITTGLKDVDFSKSYITETDDEVTSSYTINKITGENNEGIEIELNTERVIKANIEEEEKDNRVEAATYQFKTKWSENDPTALPALYAWRYPGQYYVQRVGKYYPQNEEKHLTEDPDLYFEVGGDCPNGENMGKVLNNQINKNFFGEEVDAFSINMVEKVDYGNINVKLQYKSDSDSVWSGEPWGLILRTNTDSCLVKFDNTAEVINSLKDIYASRVVENTNYLYTYDNVESSVTSTTELVGSLKLDLKTSAKIIQKMGSENTYKTNDELLTALNNKITNAEGINKTALSHEYLNINAPDVKNSITVNTPEISITASSDKTIYNAVLKSSSDIKKQEPELFTSCPYEDMVPYSKSGNYNNQAKRFTFKLVDDKPRFTYKPSNLANTKWNIPKTSDKSGPQIDKTLFDQL